MELREFFAAHPKAALAFSGGVDSAYLLYAALRCGAEVKPYFVKTAFQPEFELRDAARLAEELGAPLTVLTLDVLGCEAVAENPADRCYHCKGKIFDRICAAAKEDGYEVLLDGTNASDDASDRPGMRALRERGVLSPLRQAGLGKAEIRRRSREAGLFTWDKPAYACLATRVPTGERLTEELLRRVETAEEALFRLGFSDFRVRVFHGAARVQVTAAQMETALGRREEIVAALRPLFGAVLLDMEARA